MRPHRILQRELARLTLIGSRRKVDFMIVGTMKGGTTALDAYLRTHPEIGMADEKELHFFDDDKNFSNGQADFAAYHLNFSRVRWRKLWGEATPIYMYWRETPARLRQYNPQLKLIVLLRNPIERAYSHWNMQRGRKLDSLSFWDALQAEPERCRESLPLQNRVFSYVARSLYAEQLERLWQHFPKEQTLVLKSEDLRNQPQQTLDAICQFLSVKRLEGVGKIDVHSRPYESRISEREKEHLKNVFASDVKKLEQLLGWDCRDWLAG